MHDPRLRATANLRSLLARAGAVALLALALPAAAHADGSGGVAPTDTSAVPVTPVPAGGPLLPAPVDLGGRIGAMIGMPVTLSGNFPGGAGRAVAVQRQDPRRGWVTVAGATAGPDGSFTAVWTLDRVGLFAMRAVLAGPGAIQASAAQTPLIAVTGYRPAKATFFGPGLFGNRTACGQRLSRSLRGIAHRSLPCGSIVELVYKGRVLRAPVVDRGPFARGIRYDLTQATARDLGFTTTDVIGAAQVASPPAAQGSR
jgi:rare lipoprotein A